MRTTPHTCVVDVVDGVVVVIVVVGVTYKIHVSRKMISFTRVASRQGFHGRAVADHGAVTCNCRSGEKMVVNEW